MTRISSSQLPYHGKTNDASFPNLLKAKPCQVYRFSKPWKGCTKKVSLRHDLYTYRVTWSEEDREYVGLCTEFPNLSWLAESQELAFKGVREIVADAVKDMKVKGESIPVPFSARQCSTTAD